MRTALRSIFTLPTPRSLFVTSLVIFALYGCDNSEQSLSASDEEAAIAQTKAHVRAGLETAGLTVESKDGSLALGGDIAGGNAQVGQNLKPPAWLPAAFPLPPDLAIYQLIIEADGQKNLGGKSPTVTVSEQRQSIAAWAAENDWELIDGEGSLITVVGSNGDVIDVSVDDGLDISLTISQRSVSFDRQQAATELKSQGSATLIFNEQKTMLEGECTIKGSYYRFEHMADNGTFASLQIDTSQVPAQGSATYQAVSDNGLDQYNLNFPTGNESEPVSSAAGNTFSVRGNFAKMGSSGMAWVPGEFLVTCESERG